MAQLIVRKLDEEVKRWLRERASRRGHSMEEEVREILRVAALADPPSAEAPLGSRIASRFAGLGLTEPFAELRGQAASPPDFEA